MKTNSRRISIIVIFAALYAVGVIFLAPISYSFFQVRLADALLPLSMIFGIPSAIGLSLGCLVSNVYGGLGLVDIIGGSVANFLACTLAWYVARKSGFGKVGILELRPMQPGAARQNLSGVRQYRVCPQ